MEHLDEEELRATRVLNGLIAGDKVYTEKDIKDLLEEVTEEYNKECQYNTISNRCFELKGAKEILEKLGFYNIVISLKGSNPLETIEAYRLECQKKTEFERTQLVKDKTGVRLDGLSAINPVNGKEIPIFISDYVLMTYGTGAIMAVPAHDERDWDFAKKFNLPIIEVVAGSPVDVNEQVFTDVATGTLVNSEFLNGLSVADAKAKIIEFLEEKGIGHAKTNFKLRDWLISRQRYWGCPIPIIHCEHCGAVPVAEKDLPVLLPNTMDYKPDGRSPLSKNEEYMNTICPICGRPARRDPDTLDTFSEKYLNHLLYICVHN